MDLTAHGRKVPSPMSGPSSSVALGTIEPRLTVPATTVPTPGAHGSRWRCGWAGGRRRGARACSRRPAKLHPPTKTNQTRLAHPPTWHREGLVDDELCMLAHLLVPAFVAKTGRGRRAAWPRGVEHRPSAPRSPTLGPPPPPSIAPPMPSPSRPPCLTTRGAGGAARRRGAAAPGPPQSPRSRGRWGPASRRACGARTSARPRACAPGGGWGEEGGGGGQGVCGAGGCGVLRAHGGRRRRRRWRSIATHVSRRPRTRKGRLRTPGFFRMAPSVDSVCRSTCSGARSTLVTTKKAGTLSASATPRCSRHMPTTPALAPTITDA